MKPFRIISWVVTVLFALQFFISLIKIINNSRGGVPIPFVLGMLIGSAIVPGVFWLINYYFFEKKNDPSSITTGITQNFSGYNGGHNAGDAVNKAKFNSALNQQGVYQSGDLYKKENNIKNQ